MKNPRPIHPQHGIMAHESGPKTPSKRYLRRVGLLCRPKHLRRANHHRRVKHHRRSMICHVSTPHMMVTCHFERIFDRGHHNSSTTHPSAGSYTTAGHTPIPGQAPPPDAVPSPDKHLRRTSHPCTWKILKNGPLHRRAAPNLHLRRAGPTPHLRRNSPNMVWPLLSKLAVARGALTTHSPRESNSAQIQRKFNAKQENDRKKNK